MQHLLHFDHLSWLMVLLVGFIGANVAVFSAYYLKGDRAQGRFYAYLICLILSLVMMVSADNFFLFIVTWAISNVFLTRLMLHKKVWRAARESAKLALHNFLLGLLFLSFACFCFYQENGNTSIQLLMNHPDESLWMTVGACFIVLAAITQSGLWPFHTWLTSSLNSPTPASAMMHAGLVNAGGFLLARFAPVLLDQPMILNLIFLLGVVSALLGSLWKLMQGDVKRMLACSTMGQMGFMVAQCGLGLFPAAIAHLCWHGLFKANLFFASGSAGQEKRLDLRYAPQWIDFLLALICGASGAFVFALLTDKNILAGDTNLFLIVIAMMGGTQFALPMIRSSSLIKAPMAWLVTLVVSAFYAGSVRLVESLLSDLNLLAPQPLNVLHVTALIVFALTWLTMLFVRKPLAGEAYPNWVLKLYVRSLNASQPHPDTVTTHRNQYQF